MEHHASSVGASSPAHYDHAANNHCRCQKSCVQEDLVVVSCPCGAGAPACAAAGAAVPAVTSIVAVVVVCVAAAVIVAGTRVIRRLGGWLFLVIAVGRAEGIGDVHCACGLPQGQGHISLPGHFVEKGAVLAHRDALLVGLAHRVGDGFRAVRAAQRHFHGHSRIVIELHDLHRGRAYSSLRVHRENACIEDVIRSDHLAVVHDALCDGDLPGIVIAVRQSVPVDVGDGRRAKRTGT